MRDALALAGAVAVVYGACLVHAPSAYTIATDPQRGAAITTTLGAELVAMDTTAEECRRRILAEPLREPVRERQLRLIDAYKHATSGGKP